MGDTPGIENFKSLRDVMRQIAKVTVSAAHQLEAMANNRRDEQPRNALVLETVANQRREQADKVQAYLREGPADLLDTYYQYTPEVPLDNTLLRNLQGKTADDVLAALSKVDDVIARVYEELTRRAELPALRQVLEGFAAQHHEQQTRAAGASQAAYDM